MISVIIASYNRPGQLRECVRSIQKSSFSDYEIIIVNQYTQKNQIIDPKIFIADTVTVVNTPVLGKSRALNLGIVHAKGDICAFTDDDCIVKSDWLSTIHSAFTDHPQVQGVFGTTLPYRANLHAHMTCPCTFTIKSTHGIHSPQLHWKYIGYSNNMAFRKNVFSQIGYFKQWLGPGSIGVACEDGEFALRSLIHNYQLIDNKSMTVFHNKWLNKKQALAQHLSYQCGEMACYGYFAFQKQLLGKTVVRENLSNSYWKIRKLTWSFLTFQWNTEEVKNMKYSILEGFYREWGLLIGAWFSFTDPIK